MHLLEAAISLFAPHVCLGCKAERNRLLCGGCAQSLPRIPSRCYRCKAVTTDFAVCAICRPQTPLRCVLMCTPYTGLAKELIHHTKYERAQAGVSDMASLMSELAAAIPQTAILVPIPTATGRVRQRGYDHAYLLARLLARQQHMKSARLLSRLGQAHQVGSGRSARRRQLQSAFRPVRSDVIRGRHIILVDDVLTTGATLEAAARTLKRAGAVHVDAWIFAQA